jgi:RNA polymerase sigma factor (sigma-70 family)
MTPELQAPAGDPVWSALIAQHDHRVVLSLLARGVRLDRARELAHDTWSRLYEQHARGRLRRLELPGLAITQAAFLAAEDARRTSQRKSTPLELAPELAALADPGMSAEDRLLSRELLARASEALDSCSTRAQAVFTLAYENPDTPQADLAQKFGLSLQRVRQILCEVRAKIRAAIEESSHE